MKRRSIVARSMVAGLLLSIAIITMWQTVEAADVRVIASPNAPVDTMDQKMIKRVFLGKKTTWSDGRPIEVVILTSGDVHKAFLKIFVKKIPSQFSAFWRKQIFSGKGAEPKSFSTESELVAYVARRELAVGYVSSSTDVTSVKVVNEK
ncbi:hypothetical protein [Desulfosarcina variabilis]|uniref:hypothetical protein n=1 Tax=Desulfosarcina variabilis TaxID=2300 RepID=UPI003AFAABF7